MKEAKNKRAFSSILILSGLWFINILIVVFGLPFLIINKIREFSAAKSKRSETREAKKAASYLPCRINSKP